MADVRLGTMRINRSRLRISSFNRSTPLVVSSRAGIARAMIARLLRRQSHPLLLASLLVSCLHIHGVPGVAETVLYPNQVHPVPIALSVKSQPAVILVLHPAFGQSVFEGVRVSAHTFRHMLPCIG